MPNYAPGIDPGHDVFVAGPGAVQRGHTASVADRQFPRMRGGVQRPAQQRCVGVRSIPTRGGDCRSSGPAAMSGDRSPHARVETRQSGFGAVRGHSPMRGWNVGMSLPDSTSCDRSPHTRGVQLHGFARTAATRSIPACAGEKCCQRPPRPRRSIDPRVRGWNFMMPACSSDISDRSPSAGGTAICYVAVLRFVRSACAGRTA